MCDKTKPTSPGQGTVRWHFVRDSDGNFVTTDLPDYDDTVVVIYENGFITSFILHHDDFGAEERAMAGTEHTGPIVGWCEEFKVPQMSQPQGEEK